MIVAHFLERKIVVLSQLRDELPHVGDRIKIKGRKGKVLNVLQTKSNLAQIEVEFEKVVKPSVSTREFKKKR
ncbi:hypothetical protein [Bacillus andreraoultii]|uniref:hypothetical protein n=1 Tax=Bacillus andreraoultii TaxID=1499685 RepID=UPI00053B0680|nr:hypothetical protein [Bacillus andreraoultii]